MRAPQPRLAAAACRGQGEEPRSPPGCGSPGKDRDPLRFKPGKDRDPLRFPPGKDPDVLQFLPLWWFPVEMTWVKSYMALPPQPKVRSILIKSVFLTKIITGSGEEEAGSGDFEGGCSRDLHFAPTISRDFHLRGAGLWAWLV